MNYQAFTNDSLTMMYEGIRGALAADEALKGQGEEPRFRVRETSDLPFEEWGAGSGPRLFGRLVLFWTTIRGGLTAAGAMFGHHSHSFVFIGAQTDTLPIRKHEPMIRTNLLDYVFSHFSAQPVENLRILDRQVPTNAR